MITIILLNIIEVIIDDAPIVQPQGLFNLSSHVPRACIRHFHWGGYPVYEWIFGNILEQRPNYVVAQIEMCQQVQKHAKYF